MLFPLFLFFVAQQPKPGTGRLFLGVARSRTIRHTHARPIRHTHTKLDMHTHTHALLDIYTHAQLDVYTHTHAHLDNTHTPN